MASYEDIRVSRDGPVGWITLSRPEKLNALRAATFSELENAISELEDESGDRHQSLCALPEGSGGAVLDAMLVPIEARAPG